MDKVRTLYTKVSSQLDKLDFSALWGGFKRYPFALYTSNTVVLENGELPWDTRFRGNTAIEYENGFIAIWNVENDFDFLSGNASTAETLAASLVHEMFHAYQMECGETRFPQDLSIQLYPWDAKNFALKQKENAVLAEAFSQANKCGKLKKLAEFCALRAEREKLYSDMLELEYLSETAEGMAEYMGLMALKALAGGEYEKRLTEYCDTLIAPGAMLFNVRRISYFSGALLLLCASDAGIDFHHELSGTTSPVYRFISDKLDKVSPPALTLVEQADVAKQMNAARAKRESEITEFKSLAGKKVYCSGRICGYDPMNMTRFNDLLYCKTFVMIDTADGTVTLEGKSLLFMEQNSPDSVLAYAVIE